MFIVIGTYAGRSVVKGFTSFKYGRKYTIMVSNSFFLVWFQSADGSLSDEQLAGIFKAHERYVTNVLSDDHRVADL